MVFAELLTNRLTFVNTTSLPLRHTYLVQKTDFVVR